MINALAQWFSGFWGGDDLRRRWSQQAALCRCQLLTHTPQSALRASVCVKHRVPRFPWRKGFSHSIKRLKPAALTVLAPVSHNWFLLSWWSTLCNGLAHLLWNELPVNSFIFQYNAHTMKPAEKNKSINARPKSVFEAALSVLKKPFTSECPRIRWLPWKMAGTSKFLS